MRRRSVGMYDAHFGFHTRPFALDQPAEIERGTVPQAGVAKQIAASLREGRSVILTGSAGIGKSFVVAAAIAEFVKTGERTIEQIDGADLTSESLASGLLLTDDAKPDVIVVENAHTIPPAAFDGLLRLLKDRAAGSNAVFVGRSKLLDLISTEGIADLRLRVLDANECESFISERVALCGNGDVFDDAATGRLASASGGVIRRLIELCDHSLRVAFRDRKANVTTTVVEEAISESFAIADNLPPIEQHIESPFLEQHHVEPTLGPSEPEAEPVACFEVGAGIESEGQSGMRLFETGTAIECDTDTNWQTDQVACFATADPTGMPIAADPDQDFIGDLIAAEIDTPIESDVPEWIDSIEEFEPAHAIAELPQDAPWEDAFEEEPEEQIAREVIELSEMTRQARVDPEAISTPAPRTAKPKPGRFAQLFSRLRKQHADAS